jgi:ribosome-associated protein YbcJ (S4-like RNA binding protein)
MYERLGIVLCKWKIEEEVKVEEEKKDQRRSKVLEEVVLEVGGREVELVVES